MERKRKARMPTSAKNIARNCHDFGITQNRGLNAMDKDEINRRIDARINKKVAFIKALKPLETDELWAEVVGAKDAFGNHTKVRNRTIDWLMLNADAFDDAMDSYCCGMLLQ